MDSLNDSYDLVIIGAGPAGLTAAIYGSRAGLSVLVIEKLTSGGQTSTIVDLENYPGFVDPIDGFTLSMSMADQAKRLGAHFFSGEVTSVGRQESFVVALADRSIRARSVIFAMGAVPRDLAIPGSDTLRGRGVSYCATCDGNFFRGKDVVVVGGGNTAAADAIYLAGICSQVHIVHRRDSFRASALYVDRLSDLDNVSIHWNSVPTEIHEADGRVSGLSIESVDGSSSQTIDTQAVFVAIGTVPQTGWLPEAVELDGAGYIVADESGKTTVPGLFCAGDIRTKPLRQVVTACSDGANAAQSAADYLAS